MPSCIQSIQNKINDGQLDSITQLSPNTAMPISMNSSNKQLFILEIIKSETVRFTLNLVSSFQPTNIGVTINFYQITENEQIISLGYWIFRKIFPQVYLSYVLVQQPLHIQVRSQEFLQGFQPMLN